MTAFYFCCSNIFRVSIVCVWKLCEGDILKSCSASTAEVDIGIQSKFSITYSGLNYPEYSLESLQGECSVILDVEFVTVFGKTRRLERKLIIAYTQK